MGNRALYEVLTSTQIHRRRVSLASVWLPVLGTWRWTARVYGLAVNRHVEAFGTRQVDVDYSSGVYVYVEYYAMLSKDF